MGKKKVSIILLLAAVFCVIFSGCGSPEEGKVNQFIRENVAYAEQINNLKNLYGDAMNVKTYGKGRDLYIEMDVNASIEGSLNETELTGVEESLKPYLSSLRKTTGDNGSNIVYLVKDKSGREIVKKTIS
ncbi:MAG TPA: hypothetical protein DEO32_02825 [Ruminococcaceae bacterium]|nr:hypothetical protein [Oscillospiraceae bacterium]